MQYRKYHKKIRLYIRIKKFIELSFEEKTNMGKESRKHIEKI